MKPSKGELTSPRRIALVFFHQSENIDDPQGLIATSITEWVDVSDEDFRILRRYSNCGYRDTPTTHNKWTIVEQPFKQKEAVDRTLKGCLEKARKAARENEEYERKEAERKKKYQETKKARELEKAKKIIEKYNNPQPEEDDEF